MLVLYGYSIAHPPSFKEPERRQQEEQLLVVPQSYEEVKGDRDDAHLHQQAVCMCPFVPSVGELALCLTPLSLLNNCIEHAKVWVVVRVTLPTDMERHVS